MPHVDPSNTRARHGSPVSRSTWVAGGVVAAVFLLGAVVLFARFGASTGARATLRTYEVLSDTSVRVQLEVARPAGQTAVCSVTAFGEDGQSVADSLVTVPSGQDRTTRVTQALTTRARAVAVQVGDCTGRPSP